jgi:prepilin signal peptidase PulO-like enzyme (type II secretory pathway)
VRRPIVELVAAAGSVALALALPQPAQFWPSWVLGAVLLLVIVIDLEHRLILHVVTGPAAVGMALIGSLDPSRGPAKTLLGGAVGFLAVLVLFWLGGLFARVVFRIRGQPIEEVPFGFGDVTLAGVVGLAVGYPGIIVALTLAILAGGLFSLGYLLVMISRGRYVAFTPIPYSPFLVLGALVVFIGARTGLFG